MRENEFWRGKENSRWNRVIFLKQGINWILKDAWDLAKCKRIRGSHYGTMGKSLLETLASAIGVLVGFQLLCSWEGRRRYFNYFITRWFKMRTQMCKWIQVVGLEFISKKCNSNWNFSALLWEREKTEPSFTYLDYFYWYKNNFYMALSLSGKHSVFIITIVIHHITVPTRLYHLWCCQSWLV